MAGSDPNHVDDIRGGEIPGSSVYALNPVNTPLVIGTDGDDVLEGWAELEAGILADVWYDEVIVEGRAGDDVLEGEDGDDVLVPGSGDDTVRGGAGIDTVAFYDADAAVTVDLAGGWADPVGAGFDSLQNIENVFGSAQNDTIRGDNADNGLDGGAGDDVVEGRAGDDRLYGESVRYEDDAGADTLRGGKGDDELFGGNGDDTLDGGEDDDLLDGEAGTDTATYETAAAAVVVSLSLSGSQNTAGAGVDTLRSIENLTGSAFSDHLFGSGGDNTLLGEHGDDTLSGNDGDDVLRGGEGDDGLNGGDGVDEASYVHADGSVIVLLAAGTAAGALGEDTLVAIENVRGGAHDDVLGGDGGDNRLRGFDGADTLDGGAGDDALDGGDGEDTAVYAFSTGGVTVDLQAGRTTLGPAGYDTLSSIENLVGSNFADYLKGDVASNDLLGMGGDDVLEGGTGVDRLDGGDGFDRATWRGATAAVTIDLAAGTATGAQDADTLVSIEWVVGSAHADTIRGTAAAETLDGGDGDDTITGSFGDDTLIGGQGTDTARYLAASAAVTVDLAAGTASVGTGRDAERDTLAGFEVVQGSSNHGDTLSGDGRGNTLEGRGGDDRLRGRGGNDRLDGGDGADTALYDDSTGAVTVNLSTGTSSGAAGADTLIAVEHLTGSDGFGDTLTGDGGDNTLRGLGGDDLLEGRAGNDTLDGGAGNDTASYRTAADLVLADLSEGSARFAAGEDTLIDIENLTGSNQWGDQLIGDDGTNVLKGLGGDDTLLGGLGADILTGGAGADIFVYTDDDDADHAAAPLELITDFQSGVDKIDFSRFDPDDVNPGDQAYTFIGGGPFTATGRAELRFEDGLLYGDGNGDGNAGTIIQLPNVAALVAGDFIL